MKTLPLTVMVAEGPQARVYLSALAEAGFIPERVLLLLQTIHPSTKKKIGRFVPGKLRQGFIERSQASMQMFWPRQIAIRNADLFEAILSAIEQQYPGARAVVERTIRGFDYSNHCNHIERLPVTGLKDEALRSWFESQEQPTTVLYSGGGIVPKALLETQGVKIIHIHPGHLPHVRGADGLLWSMLVRGKPGVGCFYMAPGIDTGDIITTGDLPALTIALNQQKRPDDMTLYRAVFSFIDPYLRARYLVDRVLPRGDDLHHLPVSPQDESEGLTYHFMHSALRSAGLRALFPDA